ncbi:MAG TPA: hypothetical protein VMF06_10885 [Candidatus Limnocylindria bacterium]|nr:hypothetical protein [Candidatus Limnocylindria bacterium]
MQPPHKSLFHPLTMLACILAIGCASEVHVTGTKDAPVTGTFKVEDEIVSRSGTVPVDISLPNRQVHEYTIRKLRKEDTITVQAKQADGQSVTVEAPPGSAGVMFTQTKPGCWSSQLIY